MFRLGLVQCKVGADKARNLQQTRERIQRLCQVERVQMVALAECFNSPYGTKFFGEYAEPIPDGPSCRELSAMAKENGIYLVGGSIPERDGDRLYNTCTVYDPRGTLIAKHRKVHLFDIDIPGKISFRESETLSAGNQVTTFDTEYGKMGVGICYDMRFPELAMMAARQGAKMMFYPGAFNMTTGPLHWELLLRARAVDNQIYVAGISPARDASAGYIAWGHSMVVDPLYEHEVTYYNNHRLGSLGRGAVVAQAEQGQEGTVVADIDLGSKVQQVRDQIPVTKQRRFDVYPDVAATSST